MHRLLLTACLLALSGFAFAQAGLGSLVGVVTGPDGAPVADAPIQAKGRQSGTVGRTVTSADGRYTLGSLPADTYDVSIAMPLFAYKPFARPNVVLPAGQALPLDIRLEAGGTLNTLADDPGELAALLRKRATIPSRPVPRLPDGKPDLSGVWLANPDLYPEAPQALPWAAALARERSENNQKDAPHTRCLPGGLPTPAATPPFMAKFVHTPSLLVVLFEDAPGFRQIFLDGRGHPADPDPSWVGHSIGTWDGDELVVDTVGYNDKSWIGTFPHTEMLRVTERYRRPDFGHLEIRVTFDDPGTFTKPLIRNLIWDLTPDEDLIEFVCENNKAERLVGK